MKSLVSFSSSALSRAEMKKVTGGCSVYLPPGWKPAYGFSYSASSYTKHADGSQVITGLSKSKVNDFMASGGRWCCTSCSTNCSWC